MSEPICILVLEDDPDMRRMLCDALDEQGYRPIPAACGAEALECARMHTFDLVVADIRMEGMDGLEVLERVKSEQPAVGSLVVTGYSTESDPIRALRLGVGDYLKKPFRLAEFLGSVNRILKDRHEAEQRTRRERELRTAAQAALRGMARALDSGTLAGEFGCVWTGTLALRLANELGLEAAQATHLEMASVLATLRSTGTPVEELEKESPEDVRRLLSAPTPTLDLVLAARAVCTEQGEVPASMALELARRFPDRFEVALLEGLEAALEQ
ncbi:MAG: response regulator, partial [Candidatus Eremiobacterota bacterium]